MTDTFVSAPKLTCCKMTNCSQAQTRHERIPNVKLKMTSFAISKRLLPL